MLCTGRFDSFHGTINNIYRYLADEIGQIYRKNDVARTRVGKHQVNT